MGVGAGPAGADEEDVTFLEGCALGLCDLLEGWNRDGCGCEVVDWDVICVGPGGVVEEDAAANDASIFSPCC